MIKIIILLIAFNFNHAKANSFELDYDRPNYNFVLPATTEDRTLNFFDDCEDHKGLSASAKDEQVHIFSIHKDGSRIEVPVDSGPNGN